VPPSPLASLKNGVKGLAADRGRPVSLHPVSVQPFGVDDEWDRPRRGSSPQDGGTLIATDVWNAPVGLTSATGRAANPNQDTSRPQRPNRTRTMTDNSRLPGLVGASIGCG
jgi:hypothetical protein